MVKHSLIPNRQVRAKKATKVTPMTFLLRIAAGNALILLGSSRQQLSLRIFNAEVAARRRQQEKNERTLR